MNRDRVFINRSAVILAEVRHEFDGTYFVLVRYCDGGIGRFNFRNDYRLACDFARTCTGDVSTARSIEEGDFVFSRG